MQHKTVLLHEAVEHLALQPSSVVFDATFGAGGHAEEILKKLNEEGVYIGVDVDETALTREGLPHTDTAIHLVNDNFENISNILSSLQINSVDAILADLGWRTDQFTEGNRGLSFEGDEPLHMTLGNAERYAFTAADIVNNWDEATIADIIYGYGEDRFARRIARAIVERREESEIQTTKELVECVTAAVPKKFQSKKIHPATKTFQALRIAVNDELGVLERFLANGFESLTAGGTFAVISFHSLEDRIVKHSFRELASAGVATLVTKKPQVASVEEVDRNPRARSAKLRVIKKNNVEHDKNNNSM